MIDYPAFDFRPPPDVAAPRVRVRDLKPAAPDGEEWVASILRVARDLALSSETRSFRPSRLRQRTKTLGIDRPPSGKSQWWGVVYSTLPSLGWSKRFLNVASSTPSRNAAKDVWEWVLPEGAEA